jgi:transposase-like protein
MFQGCTWQRCRVHILRNLLRHGSKAGQDMVAAAMKAVFVIQAPDQVRAHWQRVTEMLRKQFPTAVPVMEAARDDVLAFLHFPQEHRRKIWSTNPLERLNKEIKRRTNVVGSSPMTLRSSAWWTASCWSSRKKGTWSAGASSPGPPWQTSRSQKRPWSSSMVNSLRRWLEPSPEPHQIFPSINTEHLNR